MSKRKASKRKATLKRKTVKRKTAKRKASKRKSLLKRRAASKMDYVLSPPRLRSRLIQSQDAYSIRKPRIEKIPEGTIFRIYFKIDSGNMKKDSLVLGQIINEVDLICVPLKIKYEFNVTSGCLFVALGLFFGKTIAAGLVTIAIWELVKKINSKRKTKTTYVDDELKRQLVIAALSNRGEVGYTIDYTEELPIGTRFSIILASGETRSIIVNEQGKLDWI